MSTVDQKVVCKTYGEGVVLRVNDYVNETYPIAVELISGGWNTYTEDGKLWSADAEPSLSVIEE